MKALTLIGILLFGMLASCLFAQSDVSKNDYLEVTCMVIDSTNASTDTFNVNEPATYVLIIRNISDFPIPYRYSSENSSLFTVMVKSYYAVQNETGTISSTVLDSDGTLESGDELKETKTVSETEPGKYEFLIEPNFNFAKSYWPSTGPLYRVFNVIGSTEEGQ
jgi:hypothetical protein